MQNKNPGRLVLIPDAFYLGFVSLSIQVVYARIAVGFAGGNEVYLSLFYLLWLFFTGAGAIIIKKFNPGKLFLLFGIASLLLAAVFYLSPKIFEILLKDITPVQLIPPWLFLITIVAVLLPVGLLNGGLFSSIASQYKGENRSGLTYGGEAIGALSGGVITTVYYLSGGRDFSLLLFMACISLLPIVKGYKIRKIAIFSAGLLILILGIGNLFENMLLKIRYLPLVFQDSVSGRIVRYDTVKTGNITSLYSGGIKQSDFPDELTAQEIFYWTYLVKPDFSAIAFIGEGTYLVNSFLPENVTPLYIYPEKNWQKLIDREYLPPEEHCRFTDPLEFFKNTTRKFDVIIINQGDLLSLSTLRLETDRFFNYCRNSLRDNGILTVRAPAYEGIWRDDLKQRLNTLYHKLKNQFEYVYFIPGSVLTFICGDNLPAEIDADFMLERLGRLSLDSPYFNSVLIKSRLNDFKLAQVQKQLSEPVAETKSLAIGHGLSYYFSKFGFSYDLKILLNRISVVIIFLLLAGAAFILSGFNRRKCLSLLNILYFGSLSFTIELLIMYYFQISGGYLYIVLGIILGLFMFGMAVGAFWGTRYFNSCSNLPKRIYKGSLLAFLIFAVLAAFLISGYERQIILLISVILAGMGGGLGFASNAKLFDQKPGLPYGIDLGGALTGAIIGLGILYSVLYIGEIVAIFGILGIILVATNLWYVSK